MHFTSLLAQAADSSQLFNDPTPATQATNAAAFAGMAFGVVVFMVLCYVVGALLLGRIFKKAGVEAWKAWVPVYNVWVMLELGGQAGWWAILAFVPFVGIAAAVFQYIAMYRIGLRLGKEGWFVLLAIFLPVVWLAWLALDNSTWRSDAAPVAPTQTPEWTPPTA